MEMELGFKSHFITVLCANSDPELCKCNSIHS